MQGVHGIFNRAGLGWAGAALFGMHHGDSEYLGRRALPGWWLFWAGMIDVVMSTMSHTGCVLGADTGLAACSTYYYLYRILYARTYAISI